MLIASLLAVLSPGRAVAAESIPELQWPAVAANGYNDQQMTTSPQGDVTIGCSPTEPNAQDLTTYNASGTVVRHISRTSRIDGVVNCIERPVVDKGGVLYGSPRGGVNLLAYRGNTLKWRYATGCTSVANPTRPVIGADGNIYFINSSQHLIGLTPNVPSGRSQPTKILDVVVAGNYCGADLRAHRDGLAIAKSTGLTYYSYAGVSLGSPPEGHRGDRSYPINADGRLFYPTIVSGATKSLSISAYDPGRRQVRWTTSASTPGSSLFEQFVTLPLPGGGVAVVFRQDKMVSDNVPATPSEVVMTIVSLSPSGQKLWTKQLPDRDVAGNYTSFPRLSVDVKGNIVLVRSWKKPSASTHKIQSITVDVINANSGNAVIAPKILSGNADESTGAFGYEFSQVGVAVPIGPGVAYIHAHPCAPRSCGYTNFKLYAIKVAGLGMDYPRGAVIGRVPRSKAGYRSFGDSFSSGEGVEPFSTGTATPGLNTCHRSTLAYPRLIAGTSTKIPSLGSSGFRACSGAVTENITDAAQWNEGTQLDLWPDTSTKVVTLTIGGNDIGFSSFGEKCFWQSCDSKTDIYASTVNKINNELPAKLEATYKRILRYAPNAKVYVIGYPHVIANKQTSDGVDLRCPYMQDGDSNWGDARAARSIVAKLDAKISTVVLKVRSQSSGNLRLRYVPADGDNSPFKNHEICGSGTSWFQNANQGVFNPPYAFHPNKSGQEYGYKVIAQKAINAG